jgi:hypothetical protein
MPRAEYQLWVALYLDEAQQRELQASKERSRQGAAAKKKSR